MLKRLRNWWTMRGLRKALERCRCRLCQTCDVYGIDAAQIGQRRVWLCQSCCNQMTNRPYPVPLTGEFR